MNFSELSKELGVSSNTVNNFIQYGLLDSAEGIQNPNSLSDDEIKAIRKCSLLKMLGYSTKEIAELKFPEEKSFKDSLSSHIKAILDDEENTTQAAIVLQNIKRNEDSFADFDPVPYLEHLSELRARGGSFYNVNSGLLSEDDSPWKRVSDREKAYKRSHDSFSNHIMDAEEKYKRGQKEMEEKNEASTAEEDTNESEAENSDGFNRTESDYTGSFYGGFAGPFGAGMYRQKTKGSAYAAHEVTSDGQKICPHPYLRYLARMLDQTVMSLVVDVFIEFVIGVSVSTNYKLEFFEIIFSFFLLCLVEPFLLSTFGTTLGKWILGIRIRKRGEDRKLTLAEATSRTIKMARYGMGFMIPIYSFIREVKSLQECRFEKVLTWDEDCDIEISTGGFGKAFFFIIAMLIIVNVSEIIDYQAMIPSNTGNITPAQFYENCSEVARFFGFSISPDQSEFKLTTDSNGYVTSVTYEETMTSRTSISSEGIYLAFFAFGAATNGSNGFKLANDDVLNIVLRSYSDYTYNYCDVVVTNTIENNGFKIQNYLGSPLYIATDENSTLKMTFKISK